MFILLLKKEIWFSPRKNLDFLRGARNLHKHILFPFYPENYTNISYFVFICTRNLSLFYMLFHFLYYKMPLLRWLGMHCVGRWVQARIIFDWTWSHFKMTFHVSTWNLFCWLQIQFWYGIQLWDGDLISKLIDLFSFFIFTSDLNENFIQLVTVHQLYYLCDWIKIFSTKGWFWAC